MDAVETVGLIEVRVQTITGQVFTVSIAPNAKVISIKQQFQATTGIEVEPARQRLFFLGQELDDNLQLNECRPRPIVNGDTIQIFMRNVPTATIPIQDMQEAEPYYAAAHWNLSQYEPQAAVEKSSLNIRLFGIFFIVMGLINGIVAATNDINDWVNISIGALLFILGVVAIYAGLTKTTPAARQYLCSVILFILAFGGIFTASSLLNSPGASSSDILVTVLVGIFFPFFLCSFCAFCAKRHLNYCVLRDEYEITYGHLNQGGAIGQAQAVQPLLGVV